MAEERNHTGMERQRRYRERQRGGVVVRAIVTPAIKRMLAKRRWCDIRHLDCQAALEAAVQRWLDAAAEGEGSDCAAVAAAPDGLSKGGAERLRETIEGHWLVQGYKIDVWLEKLRDASALEPAFGVRSNLVAGLPHRSAHMKESHR